MGLGKMIRLRRLFAHPSGRLCSVAVDHFLGYHDALPTGLKDLPQTIRQVVAGRPDAVTMQYGVVRTCWPPYAGQIPMIVQSTAGRPDDTADEIFLGAEDALRLGADALAICAFVRGKTEAFHLRRVADAVRQADPWGLPVILHVYPRKWQSDGKVDIVFTPEEIAWCVRCGIETGVDVIKVPYTGDPTTYGEILRACPTPVVAAGGPKCPTLLSALEMAAGVVRAGAKGMTVGRNIWGFPKITAAVEAFKAVIHDGRAPAQAMAELGLQD